MGHLSYPPAWFSQIKMEQMTRSSQRFMNYTVR
jgi:hypothetical protein